VIESTASVRVAEPTDAGDRDRIDRACIDLWVAAVAARDGRVEDPAVRARAAAKFAAERVALVVAPGADDGRDADADGDGVRGFALVTAPGTGGVAGPADAAYLSLLAVDPSAQGSGLGRALLVAAVDAAHAAGHERCVLHALEDNAPALRLYRSAGFRPVGEPFPHALSGRPTRTHVV
jgi:ribosomal protein S18 acetylase RimI-like enzyme